MLYQVTKDGRYLDMLCGIEEYMKKYAWDKRIGSFLKSNSDDANGILHWGGTYDGKTFRLGSNAFAVDVQTLGIVVFTPQKLDEM